MASAPDEILPADKRAALIAKAVGPESPLFNIPFRDTYRKVPVAILPIGLPVYRAGNGRLAVLEGGHIGDNGLPADYFEKGQDTVEVQRVMHGFLSALSERPEGPIKAELKRRGQQTEPLLVTADGIVLNGNRRLAAMRDLLAEDGTRFAGFAEIEAAVVPADSTSADIEMIEAALQMAPDTKLAYGWIEKRLKLRQQRTELGMNDEEICEGYRFSGPEQIEAELAELALAERYLEKFVGTPKDYRRIDWAEEPFAELRKRLDDMPGRIATVWLAVGFTLIRAAEDDEGARPIRAYPFADPKPPYAPTMLLHRLGSDLGLWPRRPESACFQNPGRSELAALAVALGDPAEAQEHSARILGLFQEILEDHRNRPSPQLAIRHLNRLSHLMARIEPGDFSDDQRRQVAAQLDHIAALSGVGPAGGTGKPGRRGLFSRLAAKLRRLTR